MCLLVGEIAAFVFGIIALATGKLKLTRTKEARGTPARIAGVLLLLPLPVAFLVGLGVGAMLAAKGQVVAVPPWLAFLELGIFLFFMICAFTIAGVYGVEPERKIPFHEEEEEPEDEEDRYRRRFDEKRYGDQ
jgi:hypothetical protein